MSFSDPHDLLEVDPGGVDDLGQDVDRAELGGVAALDDVHVVAELAGDDLVVGADRDLPGNVDHVARPDDRHIAGNRGLGHRQFVAVLSEPFDRCGHGVFLIVTRAWYGFATGLLPRIELAANNRIAPEAGADAVHRAFGRRASRAICGSIRSIGILASGGRQARKPDADQAKRRAVDLARKKLLAGLVEDVGELRRDRQVPRPGARA